MRLKADLTQESILAGYVFEPLIDFGLVEHRKPGDWPGVTGKDTIRVTALWRKFIQFAMD